MFGGNRRTWQLRRVPSAKSQHAWHSTPTTHLMIHQRFKHKPTSRVPKCQASRENGKQSKSSTDIPQNRGGVASIPLRPPSLGERLPGGFNCHAVDLFVCT